MIITTANNADRASSIKEDGLSSTESFISETLIEMRDNLREDLKMIKEIKW